MTRLVIFIMPLRNMTICSGRGSSLEVTEMGNCHQRKSPVRKLKKIREANNARIMQ